MKNINATVALSPLYFLYFYVADTLNYPTPMGSLLSQFSSYQQVFNLFTLKASRDIPDTEM